MLVLMYFSNLTSVIPPFSFIPIVHGQILSSPQPNLPHVSKVWIKNSNRIFSLSSAVALVGNWKCGGTHLPAALLPNIPVQASDNFALDLLPACQRKVGIVERHGRPATRSPVARVEGNFCLVDVLIRRNCALVNVCSPLSPTLAKSNLIKKARNLSNHALRSVCCPSYVSLLDRGRHIRSQRHVR